MIAHHVNLCQGGNCTMLDLRNVLEGGDPTPEWLVEDMFYRGQVFVLAGAPGVGKSFLCNTLAFAIAYGVSFLGKAVTPGKVLYFDEENSLPDLRQYIRSIWKGMGRPNIETAITNIRYEHFTAGIQKERFKYMAAAA